MSSIFEELSALDLRYAPLELEVNGVKKPVQARRPNSVEQDVLESLYDDEYAKALVRLTEVTGDKPCELDQLRSIYRNVPRPDLVSQLMGTRDVDIQRVAFEKVNFDFQDETDKLASFENEKEREEYLQQKKDSIKAAFEAAKAEIRSEYDHKSDEELAELLSQVNINVKAVRCARQAQEANFIYFTLYDLDGNRFCPSIEKLREKFTSATITNMVEQIGASFQKQTAADLPFESPGVNAHDGQPSSPDTSVAATKGGGKRTKTTRGDSKPSTTRVSGTAPKKA